MKPPIQVGVLICVALTFGSTVAPSLCAQEDRWIRWDEAEVTPEKVETELAAIRSYLGELPADAAEGTPRGNLRLAANRRVQLLEEMVTLIRSGEELEGLRGNVELIPALTAELDALREPVDFPPPEDPTVEEFEVLGNRSVALKDAADAARKKLTDAAARVDQLAANQRKTDERSRTAEERIRTIEAQLASAPSGEGTDLLQLQISNARLNARYAALQSAHLRRTISVDAELEPFRTLALQVAEAKLAQHEKRLASYSTALSATLLSTREAQELALNEKRALAENSSDPTERFVARWQVEIAVSEKGFTDTQPIQIDVTKEIAEQQERLENNRLELERLKSDVKSYGTSGAVGQAIQRTFQQLPQRRRAIEFSVKPRFEEKLTEYSNRRFDVDQLLFELNERFRTEIAGVGETLDSGASRRFLARAEELRTELRNKLQQERRALSEAISKIEQLTQIRRDRLVALEGLEDFVHTEVFFIQDVAPFGREAVLAVSGELEKIRVNSLRLVSKKSLTALTREFQTIERILAAIAIALGLPIATLWIRRRLRRLLRREGIEDGRGFLGRAGLLLVALIQVIVFPSALLLLAYCLGRIESRSEIAHLASRVIRLSALFFILRGFARSFFSEKSLTVRMALLKSDTAAQLYRSIRLTSLAVAFFLVPFTVLVDAPYELSSLPRLLFIVFLAVAGFALHRAFRGSALVFRDWLGDEPSVAATRLVRVWGLLLGVSLIAIPLLELTGRRFAAKAVGTSLLLSIATWIILPVIYQLVVPILERWASSPPPDEEPEEGAPPPEDETARRARVIYGARMTLGGIGVVSFIFIWGINELVWNVLKEWQLYAGKADPADGSFQWVTAGDLLFAVLAMVITAWFLRHLPGIYDVAVFPRFPVDRGLRYAIVTISRYGLFFVGVMIAFRALQLNLTQLGWLVAAMGIGLGFGLQEIVSNFVSGLILLVERPIRPGDLITVGNVIGRVQRINIRATTVLNGDRQEVIVPNRSLIASEVTNWTLKDQIVRLKVLMGVAYGSDITKVREIILGAATADPDVLADPKPELFFVNHGESSLDFELWVYVAGPQFRFPTMDRLNEAMNRALDEHGVEIPFPQRDLHVRSEVTIDSKGAKNSESG